MNALHDLFRRRRPTTPTVYITGHDDEFRATITFYYGKLFHRDPDPDGMASWLEQLRRGMTGLQLEAELKKSPEYTGDVELPPGPDLGGTRVINITQGEGQWLNRMYSYWSSVCWNSADIYVFCGNTDGQVHFFRIDPNTLRVTKLGPLLPFAGTGEGWYWDRNSKIYLCDGPMLKQVDPFTGRGDVVMATGMSGCDLWQAHSSDDGQTHCATVRDTVNVLANGAYPKLGTIVRCPPRLAFYGCERPPLDESAVTSDGRYCIIKEADDNRIITLSSGDERWLSDAEGALGHSDCGASYAVGEADKPESGQCIHLDLDTLQWRTLFNTRGMGHISVKGGRWLLSDDTHVSTVLPLGGVFPLFAHGMRGNDYDHQVQANLSPCGRVAAYVSNRDGQNDVYVAVL